MSNLLKRGSTIDKSERIIDYNELIRAKLTTILESEDRESANPDGFINGLNAQVVEELIADPEEGSSGISAAEANQQLEEQAARMREEADQIVSEANEQAQQIVEQAQEHIEQAMEQAKEQGYQEGRLLAQKELQEQQSALEQSFAKQREALEEEYRELRKKMEPELVAVLTEVFRNVTLTAAEDDQDILLHLINHVLKDTETSKEFVIKASPKDYEFLIHNQGKLYCAMTKEVMLDIVSDASLTQNQCIVETDGGVFNCSLDIELNNLIKKIKLLSCM